MAVFHLNAKVISRGRGQSAIAAAAYRSGEKLRDEQAGEQKSYKSRIERILFTDIMAPKDAPEWAHDRNRLWNEAERAEKRKDAQLAREIEISLPHELTAQQREWLVKDFAREAFVRKGYAVDIAIHAPNADADQRNYHAHLMITMRTLGPEGFARLKDRELNRKTQLGDWREQWAHLANRHLERHGHQERIDHRSLKAQGIEREPTVHVGYAGHEIAQRGGQSDRMDALQDVLSRNGIRFDLRAVDRELEKLEETQRLQLTAAYQKLQQALRSDERRLHTPVARQFSEGAREAAKEVRQERREETFWQQQDGWRASRDERMPSPGTPKQADGGLRVVDGATGAVSKLGDFVAGLLAGRGSAAPESKPGNMKAFISDPAARKEQQLARITAARQAQADQKALENMRRDMEAGRGLSAADIRNLTPAHLMQLHANGDDGVRQMVEEARKRSERDEGRERER